MESVIGKYSKYVKDNYDLDNPLIKLKYDHSIRVASLMIYLANRLKLNSDDIILAFYIGLFHDLGRYREVVRSNTFNNLTFDHGAYSNKILFNDGIIKNFDIKEEDYLVIRKALYYHNKKDIGKDLNERELLFTNMIRDVDKLDILDIRSKGKKLYFNDYPNTKILVTCGNSHIGSQVIKYLLKKNVPPTNISTTVRSEAKAEKLKEKGIEIKIADYKNPESLEKAFKGVDRIYMVSSILVMIRYYI